MNFETPNFIPAIPEIFVLTMACLILIVDLFVSDKNRIVTYLLSQVTLIGAFILSLLLMNEPTTMTFSNTFILDPMSSFLKLFIYLSVFVVFLYSRAYLKERDMFRGEFFVLGLAATLGMMVMVSASNLLTIYLGLELLSLSMYAMVAMNRDSLESSEAAMKYFVLGAMASAMLLYGMSMIYGVTGSLNLAEISAVFADGNHTTTVATFGLVFLLVGVAFKLGAVPFHMWVPDVYQGSPTAVTLFLSSAPKLAAFAMMMRLLVDGLSSLETDWHGILVILSVLSIAIGNVVAIAQTNIKRMLAYSGISHIGFLLMGMLAATPEGFSSAMYYAVVYVLMSLGGFGMIILMSRKGFEADELSDYKGLNDRNPWYALMMMFIMFSMAGVPPFLGFWAKFAVIKAVVNIGMINLAIIAVFFSVIGAFYYLRIIKLMYFDKPETDVEINPGTDLRLVFSINAIAVLILGLFPDSLLIACQNALGM